MKCFSAPNKKSRKNLKLCPLSLRSDMKQRERESKIGRKVERKRRIERISRYDGESKRSDGERE